MYYYFTVIRVLTIVRLLISNHHLPPFSSSKLEKDLS